MRNPRAAGGLSQDSAKQPQRAARPFSDKRIQVFGFLSAGPKDTYLLSRVQPALSEVSCWGWCWFKKGIELRAYLCGGPHL